MWLIIIVSFFTSQLVPCFTLDETYQLPEQTTESNYSEETTTEYLTTEEIETTTVVKTTLQPMPTLPPALQPTHPSTVCWCDKTIDTCDMNCCCDSQCSISQKQVFTYCSDQVPIYDEKHCYSSNFFYKKPSDVKSIPNQGLFCIVRDNLSTMKEFQTRGPITTVEDFEKTVRKIKRFEKHQIWTPKFSYEPYKSGSIVWTVHNNKFAPFHIVTKTFGDLCLSSSPVTYLNNVETECDWKIARTEPECSQAVNEFLSKFRVKILTSPLVVNITDLKSPLVNCSSSETCIPLQIFLCKSPSKCSKIDKLKPKDCAHMGLKVEINFFHNGTEGIQSANATIQLLNTTILKTSVKYLWNHGGNDGFLRSGNPGYIRGRPILAGRKIVSAPSESPEKKEVIEMTLSPKGWLTVFGSENGICSSKRQPVLFSENLRQLCSLKLERQYFTKNGCNELQTLILETLIQDTKANFTNFNKYLGVYGNSRVGVITDWVQIIIEYFPLMSTQPHFSNASYGLICKQIFTHVYFDIAIGKFGSFSNPQLKIIGALARFAPPKDLFVRCKNPSCEEIAKNHFVKLMTEVNFVDVSQPATRKFAQPPGLEAKLPHDFFYPFFAFNNSRFCSPSFILLINSLLIILN